MIMFFVYATEICIIDSKLTPQSAALYQSCRQENTRLSNSFSGTRDIPQEDIEAKMTHWENQILSANIVPLYKRTKKPGELEIFDFEPFLKRVMAKIVHLTHVLEDMEGYHQEVAQTQNESLSERYHTLKKTTKENLDLLHKRHEVYKDKHVYLLQYCDKPPRKVCFLLHGLSNCPTDVAKYAPMVEEVLYVIPQGFEPFYVAWPIMTHNYQWFDVGCWWSPDKIKVREGLARIRPIFIQWLDDVSEMPGISHDDLILCGPSQGAITALDIVRHHPKVKHCIAVSGAIDPESDSKKEAYMKDKNILMIHATNDEVVPSHLSVLSAEKMRQDGAQVQECTFESLGENSAECHRIFKQAHVQNLIGDFMMAVLQNSQVVQSKM
jgi:predicted esterase